MLDKNPEQIVDSNLEKIKIEFSSASLNTILCSKPFVKTAFLNHLINSTDYKIIFLDFDLLYSGYIVSNLITENQRVTRIFLDKENWNRKLSEVVSRISLEKYLVIIDSLNGMNNVFPEKDTARFINASLMLLAACGKKDKSVIIAAGIARKKESGWILVPGGRQVIEYNKSKNFLLEESGNTLLLKEQSNNSKKVFEINISKN